MDLVTSNDWVEMPLGDVAEFQNGGAWNESAYSDSGVKVVRVTNCKNGTIDLDACKFLPEELFDKYARHELKVGDVVVATVGSHPTQPKSVVGRASVVPNSANGALLNQNAVRLRANGDYLDQAFLRQIVQADTFKQYIAAHARGAASQVRMSIELLKKFPVYMPSLPIQGRIAGVLSAYDDLIENNSRRIEILEEMVRRLYEEWFVHFRFPGHESMDWQDSELGRIPSDFHVLPLDSVGKIVTGKTPSKKRPEFFGDEVPFIKLPDMHGQIFVIRTSEALSTDGAASQKTKMIPANSLCVSCIGTAGIVVINSEISQTNQQINTVIPDDAAKREFLYFALKGLEGTINQYGATGATMTNLSRGKFAALKIVYPPTGLLHRFSSVSAPLFDQILVLQRKNQNLLSQRDLLLPKLVSGEIDVSELEPPVDEEIAAA
ncbi:restriction endonuclease subunit S [Microbulbifer pacificus]|uniref:Restriction endonuclease subunit S n=1 Tax=Microbulbifer pacificus TaxID=407164 RepID=A0AAU0MZ52_9GAMM|nr:restriction endonuclease subunit S [Microbulbifer pacificus]WOX04714.1 restriction endonuclease subunit S [Microbulbifer pacificus]